MSILEVVRVAEPNELALAEMKGLLVALRHKENRKVEVRVPPELVEGRIPSNFEFGGMLDIELLDNEALDLDATLPIS